MARDTNKDREKQTPSQKSAILDRLDKKAKELTKANPGCVYEIQEKDGLKYIKRMSGIRPHKKSKKVTQAIPKV